MKLEFNKQKADVKLNIYFLFLLIMKVLSFNFLLLSFLALWLGLTSSCQGQFPTEENTSKSQNTIDEDIAEKPIEEPGDKNIKKEAESISPSKRLKAVWTFIDPESSDSFDYRINIEDTEQRKIIFSRKMNVPFHELAEPASKDKLIKIEKLSNELLLISQPEKYAAEGQVVQRKYLLISPDTDEIKELDCKDITERFQIISFNEKEKTYKCKDYSIDSPKEAEYPLPEFKNLNKTETEAKKQIKENKELKIRAELSPFDEVNRNSIIGERANLKVFKDNKLIYEKNFSGHCSDCKLVNQDHWQEGFKIEQLMADKVLLSQKLAEIDDTGKLLPSEFVYSSLLIIPSKNKIIHLDCGENSSEIDYAFKIDQNFFYCQKLIANQKSDTIKRPLPKI